MTTKERLDRDIDQLISENGVKSVVAALARYCHRPLAAHYPAQVMATTSRRLIKICKYLDEASQ